MVVSKKITIKSKDLKNEVEGLTNVGSVFFLRTVGREEEKQTHYYTSANLKFKFSRLESLEECKKLPKD